MTQKSIGFIGVGLMGHGMAKNLVEKGWQVCVLGHRNRAPVEDLVRRGAVEAKDVADAVAQSDIVFLCVTGTPEVEDLLYRPGGVLASCRAGQIVIDTSSAGHKSGSAQVAFQSENPATVCDRCDASHENPPANTTIHSPAGSPSEVSPSHATPRACPVITTAQAAMTARTQLGPNGEVPLESWSDGRAEGVSFIAGCDRGRRPRGSTAQELPRVSRPAASGTADPALPAAGGPVQEPRPPVDARIPRPPLQHPTPKASTKSA